MHKEMKNSAWFLLFLKRKDGQRTHPGQYVKEVFLFPNAIICLGFTSRRGRVRRRDARSIRIGSSSRFEKNTIFYRSRQKKKLWIDFSIDVNVVSTEYVLTTTTTTKIGKKKYSVSLGRMTLPGWQPNKRVFHLRRDIYTHTHYVSTSEIP